MKNYIIILVVLVAVILAYCLIKKGSCQDDVSMQDMPEMQDMKDMMDMSEGSMDQ